MAISLMELVYVPTFLVDFDGINVGKYLPVKWIVRDRNGSQSSSHTVDG